MADEFGVTEKPKAKTAQKQMTDAEKTALCKKALERHQRWIERERENIDAAYDDLRFKAGEQWDEKAKNARKDRPTLTCNEIPQFIRQVTGDMRQMRPSIKTVPVDSRGDKKTSETLAGMIRYIENRSDAAGIYIGGADSQVTCGIGHWKVKKEYADGTTFNQELRIAGIDDQVAVAWDPDAKMPMKEDAKWCLIPVDVSRETFEENYPDASVEDFDDATTASADGWFDADFVRIAEYWVKTPAKRVLALMPDGAIADLTDKDEAERLEIGKTAKRVEQRDSYKVCRYLITACHVLEETDWPGMDIPIIPVVGEEVVIGKRTVRHGLTRFARDYQRMLNYYSSAEAEVVALQPKAPWLATEKNVEQHRPMWDTANTEAHSVLLWTPDKNNGNAPPQRVQPAVSSQGISEGIERSHLGLRSVIGIYDAGLGAKSNETSGVAINARDRQSDTGTFVYIDNWSRSIRRTGAIIIGLIPHVYDTERMIRIMGEDGHVDLKWINRPMGMEEIDPSTGQPSAEPKIENDVTVGAYDVVLETGPSFTTKREEAKESMKEFIQSAPEMAPAVMDLYAKSQDWPLADEISQRMEVVAPPAIQALLKKQKKEHEQQPTQEDIQDEQAVKQKQQLEEAATHLQLENQKLVNDKLRAEAAKIMAELQGGQGGPDPVALMKLQGEQQRIANDARQAELDYVTSQREAASKERLAAIQLETALVELAVKKQGLVIDTQSAVLDMQGRQQGLQHDAEQHTASLVQGFEKHSAGMEQGAESHAAKVEQMKAKPEVRPQ